MPNTTSGDGKKPNGISPDLARKYNDLDAACDEEMISLQIEHMNACKEVSERRKRHFKSAVAEGLPKDGWRLELKIRRAKRKAARTIRNILEDEEADVRESAEAIRLAIGDQLIELPLGKWGAENADKTRASGKVVSIKASPKKGGAKADMSAASKADALNVGADDEADLRSTRQKEQEALRKAESEERLKGIKKLPDGDQPTTAH